jgi:hypothetical protein
MIDFPNYNASFAKMKSAVVSLLGVAAGNEAFVVTENIEDTEKSS